MKKQIKLKHKKKLKHKLIIIMSITILIIYIIINYINKNMSPKIIHYAEQELKKLSGIIITESVDTTT